MTAPDWLSRKKDEIETNKEILFCKSICFLLAIKFGETEKSGQKVNICLLPLCLNESKCTENHSYEDENNLQVHFHADQNLLHI